MAALTFQEQIERTAEELAKKRKNRASEMGWQELMTPEMRAQLREYMQSVHESSAGEEQLEESPQCDVCGGRGSVNYAVPIHDARFGKLFPCPARHCKMGNAIREKRDKRILADSGLPPRFQELTFSSWRALPEADKENKWIAQVHAELFMQDVQERQHWVSKVEVLAQFGESIPAGMDDTPKNSIVFAGVKGVGKTGLAAAIFNTYLAQGGSPLYIRVDDVIDAVQSTYEKDSEHKKSDVLAALKQAPLLLLDDANMEKSSADKKQIMEAIMRYRHGQFLPTIVTTNMGRTAWELAWGGRAAHSLFEMAHWVDVPEPVIRRLS